MLTSAVVLGALVDVGQEDGSKAGFLNRLVRLELEPQDISVAGDRVRDFTAAKHAVLLQRVVVHLRVDGQGVVLAGCRLIKSVSLQVEVREVQGDLVVFGRQNLPNAFLVRRIFFGERRRQDGAVGGVQDSTASRFASLLVAVQFVAELT